MTYLAHRLAATALTALRQCPIWSLPAIHFQGAVVSALNRAARQADRYLLADHLNICLLLQTADIPANSIISPSQIANRKSPVRRYAPRYGPRTSQNPHKHWLGTAGTAVRPESRPPGGKSSAFCPPSSVLCPGAPHTLTPDT